MDKSYVAGLVDAKATIRWKMYVASSGRELGHVRITIDLRDENLSRSLAAEFGGSVCRVVYPPSKSRKKPGETWRWTIVSDQARRMLILIEPDLVMKRAEVLDLLRKEN